MKTNQKILLMSLILASMTGGISAMAQAVNMSNSTITVNATGNNGALNIMASGAGYCRNGNLSLCNYSGTPYMVKTVYYPTPILIAQPVNISNVSNTTTTTITENQTILPTVIKVQSQTTTATEQQGAKLPLVLLLLSIGAIGLVSMIAIREGNKKK